MTTEDTFLLNLKKTDMTELNNCPQCNAPLSEYEKKEGECFSCGWCDHKSDSTKGLNIRIEPDTEE